MIPTDPAFGKRAQTFVGRVRYDLYPGVVRRCHFHRPRVS